MTKFLAATAVFAALTGSAFAQSAIAQAPASSAPIVQMRMAEREAGARPATGLLQVFSECQFTVSAAVEAAVEDADAKGKDLLVAKRDAHAKTMKATQAEYEAKLKAPRKERDTALAATKSKASRPQKG